MTDKSIHTGSTNSDCEPLRGEILAALLESGDYDDLYRRCMLAIDNPGTSNLEVLTWIPVEERLPGDEGCRLSRTVLLSVEKWHHTVAGFMDVPWNPEKQRPSGGPVWFAAGGNRINGRVTAWAEMPRGMG